MKRVVVVAIAALVAGTLASPDQAARAAELRPAAPALVPVLSAWQPCGESECSRLTVPLDYAHPDNGKTVRLAVSRLAADPSAGAYAGIMVVNPGGPGAAGLGLEALANYVPGTAARRYDWIGFDPRGVGSSIPALHCNPNYFGPNRPNYVPRTAALRRFWVKKSARYATACGSRAANRELLPFMTTRDTAQDMENLRIALRDELPALSPKLAALDKLNYYGFSYGAYLGSVYATLYPAQVGRFVLDGVVDPVRYWYRSDLDQARGFDRNLNIFFRWIARHNSVFHLGTRPAWIRARYNAKLIKLDRRPSAGGKLGPDELADAMLGATYYVFDWVSIANAYSKLMRQGRGYPMYRLYAAANQGAEADNGYAAYLGVECSDQRRPPLSQQLSDAWRVHRTAPFQAWSITWYNMPCLTWPAPSRGKVTVNGSALNTLGTKILLINETLDAATPFSGALRVRDIFQGASLIEGVNGTTHAGSLFGVACVDNRIAAYLDPDNGAVPPRQAGRRSDYRCPANPKPNPSGRISARRADGSVDLRMRLLQAQVR